MKEMQSLNSITEETENENYLPNINKLNYEEKKIKDNYILELPEKIEDDENDNKEDENEKNISYFINKKNQGIYILREKLSVIELAEKSSNYKAALIYNVNESTIRYWRKMKERYIAESNNNKSNINKGRENCNLEIDLKLIEFIEFNRKIGNSITVYSLVLHLLKIEPTRTELSLKENQNWIYRFLLRNNYGQRKTSHKGQKLPNNTYGIISKFLSEFYDFRVSNPNLIRF